MAELAQAKMTCGYYDIADIIDGIRIGEHTYGRAPDAKVKFQCLSLIHISEPTRPY